MRTVAVAVALILTACGEAAGVPECEALGEACHEAGEAGNAEAQACHEFGHDEGNTAEACAAKMLACEDVCAAVDSEG